MRLALALLTTAALAVAGGAQAAYLGALTAEPNRIFAAAAVVLLYLSLTALILLRYAARYSASPPATVSGERGSVLIAYASQTGYAEELARSTSQALQQSNTPTRVLSFSDLDADALQAAQTALFIISTTGEGDPPDPAARFVRTVMGTPLSAAKLRYGVLALGDRSFTRFCAFGEAVDGWLAKQSATRLFDAVRVHNGDPAALAIWWQRVEEITGQRIAPPAATTNVSPWTLIARAPASPASGEHPAYYVSLQPLGALPHWTAGDVAVVRPNNDPAVVAQLLLRLGLDGDMQLHGAAGRHTLAEHLAQSTLPETADDIEALARLSPALLVKSLQPLPVREYSIASLPADGQIDLLIRQTHRPDGRLGVGSGWLTAHAGLNAPVELSVRTNASFHPPDPDRPMILIGNGTGIGGLRAHLKARAAAGATRNWLIFGERSAASDFFYRDDISKWRWARVLERVDFAFSRDAAKRTYVQDCVRIRADDIRTWVGDGAAIYVCGSLRGMSTAVTEALGEIVGEATLTEMIETGRYRRDVY